MVTNHAMFCKNLCSFLIEGRPPPYVDLHCCQVCTTAGGGGGGGAGSSGSSGSGSGGIAVDGSAAREL